MVKKSDPNTELLEALTQMNVAHRASFMALVKVLEMSGAVRAEDVESMLRISAVGMAKRGITGGASLVSDLADALDRTRSVQ